jgi:HK97 family phage prohead protease
MTFTEALHPRGMGAQGGQFVAGGGGQSAGAKTAPKKAGAHPRGSMAFDGKRGPGYGVKGGDKRVHSLQRLLNKLGFTDGAGKKLADDGKLGPRTTAAIKRAQRSLGMKADGVATPDLLHRLAAGKKTPSKAASKAATLRKVRADMKAQNAPAVNTDKGPPKFTAAKTTKKAAPVLIHRRSEEVDEPMAALATYARTFALDDIQISRSYSDGRTVEAYAAVFGTPAEIRDTHGHYLEVIDRSAFNRTISHGIDRVGVFYHHGMTLHGTPSDVYSVPIGRALEVKADGRGLRTITRYNDGPDADRVLEAIRNGAIRGYSFRGRVFGSNPMRVPRARPGQDLPTVVRTELGLAEYGPTPTPAYEDAGILAVRSAEALARNFAALDADGRQGLLRILSATPQDPADASATPSPGPGAEDSPAGRSGRLTIRRALLRAEMTRKGVRRG